ncbi:MAG: hypothetical protein DDT30_00509 [Dehalococcoidia bacterium]|nr:hypothetical protein [Bacillota bacterium]MBT9142261.1 hypothetical protein [Bacillota bacterium]
MLIVWICRNCGRRMASVEACQDNPRVSALTAQAEDDIIEIDSSGKMTIYLLCEDCLETIGTEEESDIIFLRGPEIH